MSRSQNRKRRREASRKLTQQNKKVLVKFSFSLTAKYRWLLLSRCKKNPNLHLRNSNLRNPSKSNTLTTPSISRNRTPSRLLLKRNQKRKKKFNSKLKTALKLKQSSKKLSPI